jgi:hypothetical protein
MHITTFAWSGARDLAERLTARKSSASAAQSNACVISAQNSWFMALCLDGRFMATWRTAGAASLRTSVSNDGRADAATDAIVRTDLVTASIGSRLRRVPASTVIERKDLYPGNSRT